MSFAFASSSSLSITSFLPRPSSPLVRLICTLTSSSAAKRTAKMTLAPVTLGDNLDVHLVPILSDNYAYLIHDKQAKTATFVDPAQPKPLLNLAEQLGAKVTASLTTHHHWDHAGGNIELSRLVPGIEIVGSAYETAEGVTKKLSTGDTFKSNESEYIQVTALHTPCHTNGHLSFTLNGNLRKAVFTGDTLFVAGCGRFFEGSAGDMHVSLNKVLAGLDDDTVVFCGHEYTQSNLRFAEHVEPNNEDIKKKVQWAEWQRNKGLPTVPTTIGDEKKTNPFMRNGTKSIKSALGMENADDVAVMKELRARKDKF